MNLYNSMSSSTGRFSSNWSASAAGSANSQTVLTQLVCPSSTLTNPATGSSVTDGNRALTNYKGCAGSQLESAGTPPSTDLRGGGVLTEQTWQANMTTTTSYGGIDLRQVGDGLSKTVMIGEVCDDNTSGNAGWSRGITAWVVPADVTRNTDLSSGTAPSTQIGATYVKRMGRATTGAFYSANAQGLGSFHTGGLILHGYADGHTSAISADVDSAVISSVYTRNLGEAVAELP